VRVTTPNENFANQHTPTDTFANTSPSYTAKVVKMNAAVAAAMALAPRAPIVSRPAPAAAATTGAPGTPPAAGATQPTSSEVDETPAPRPQATGPGLSRGSGYDAVLRWDLPNPEPDLAGFVVVIRSTMAPDWEREIWVGNVKEFTLKNTSIDQLVFGVKAVDKEGHESPVSAYVLAPRAR
jgi:hypothetical protein